MIRKTKILKLKGTWNDVLNDCRSTVGKEPLDKEPSEAFKKSMLIAEHSPIRNIFVKWIWEKMPHWITVHWCRHKWECYIKSQREDRNGIPREELSQVEPQNFTGEANIQHLIDTWRKRLCYTASSETRQYAENFKDTLYDIDPYIADVLVPNCVYRCGCPEPHRCNFFNTMSDFDERFKSTDIQTRYDAYNEAFYNRNNKEE